MNQNEKWKLEASCQGLDTELFFPEKGQELDPMVKKMCAACPVRIECLTYGTENQLLGSWGGLGPRARRTWNKHRQKIAS